MPWNPSKYQQIAQDYLNEPGNKERHRKGPEVKWSLRNHMLEISVMMIRNCGRKEGKYHKFSDSNNLQNKISQLVAN